jgi:hypothetical protein
MRLLRFEIDVSYGSTCDVLWDNICRRIMTQSDTDQKAYDVQIALLQSKTTSHRLALTLSLSESTIALSKRAIRRANPKMSEDEFRCRFVELHYGIAIADRFQKHLQEHSNE